MALVKVQIMSTDGLFQKTLGKKKKESYRAVTREAAPNINTWSELHFLKTLFLFIKRHK